MLVISRFVQQSFSIGDNVSVKVLGVDKATGEVRIGVSAPKNVPIHRDNVKATEPKAVTDERERQLAEGRKRATLGLSK